jgi:hypothetical protein
MAQLWVVCCLTSFLTPMYIFKSFNEKFLDGSEWLILALFKRKRLLWTAFTGRLGFVKDLCVNIVVIWFSVIYHNYDHGFELCNEAWRIQCFCLYVWLRWPTKIYKRPWDFFLKNMFWALILHFRMARQVLSLGIGYNFCICMYIWIFRPQCDPWCTIMNVLEMYSFSYIIVPHKQSIKIQSYKQYITGWSQITQLCAGGAPGARPSL